MSARFLILAVGFTLASALQATVEPPELTKLRSSYQAKLKEVAAPAKVSLLRKLEELEKDLAASSRLEQALVVREERIRLSLEENPVSTAETETVSPRLNEFAGIYNASLKQKIAPVNKTYVHALESLGKSLTAEGRLEAAITVRSEHEKISAFVTSAPGSAAPVGRDAQFMTPERRLTNSVWQLATAKTFAGEPLYFALQAKGKAYFWGFEGTWKIDRTGEKLWLNAPRWGEGVELRMGEDLSSAEGSYLRDKAPRFAKVMALRSR